MVYLKKIGFTCLFLSSIFLFNACRPSQEIRVMYDSSTDMRKLSTEMVKALLDSAYGDKVIFVPGTQEEAISLLNKKKVDAVIELDNPTGLNGDGSITVLGPFVEDSKALKVMQTELKVKNPEFADFFTRMQIPAKKAKRLDRSLQWMASNHTTFENAALHALSYWKSWETWFPQEKGQSITKTINKKSQAMEKRDNLTL